MENYVMFKMRWYDKYSDIERDVFGVTFADSISKAVEKIEETYGADDILSLFVEPTVCETPIIEFDEDKYDMILNVLMES